MSLHNGSANKARTMVDLYMANEPPEFKAKVFEILNVSGLETNDPMFLSLLLTGQIRVFVEAAIEELPRLLSEWKLEMAQSFSRLMSAMAQVSEQQQKQAEVIKENMESVSQKCVSDIKEAGMATVGAIADASGETLDRVQQTEKQVEDLSAKLAELDAKFDERERRSIENANDVVKWANSTSIKQEKVNQKIGVLTAEVAKIQRNKVWLRIADAFWSFPVLVGYTLVAIGVTWWIASTRYNHPHNVFGREIVDWSIDRINNCRETNNPKCTVWIVPPGSPLREGVE